MRRKAGRAPRESSFATRTCKRVVEKEFGGKWVKQYPYEAGWPDYLLILPGVHAHAPMALCETKAINGRLSKIQGDVHIKLAYLGVTVAVINDAEGLRTLCRTLTMTPRP